jgi:hypothetical protein
VRPDVAGDRHDITLGSTGDEDVSAFGCEQARNRLTDAFSRTGNQRDFSAQATHGFSLRCWRMLLRGGGVI